ncbi:MAG: hypothetical protein ACHBN1_36885 [Heteroscytonema crispum UTEX LB 1556]
MDERILDFSPECTKYRQANSREIQAFAACACLAKVCIATNFQPVGDEVHFGEI